MAGEKKMLPAAEWVEGFTATGSKNVIRKVVTFQIICYISYICKYNFKKSCGKLRKFMEGK